MLCHKQRARANVVADMTVIGDVEGKNVILIDDMVDTAGTIAKAADLLMSKGAKSVRALASHAIMSDPATDRINDSEMVEMIFTNSIPYTKGVSQSNCALCCPYVCRHHLPCPQQPVDLFAVSLQVSTCCYTE